ncbi:MAG TPA: DUF58 domain-containing protein, partial [Candidatus Cloacimonas sp.]|nr:DUF58 domain-containing protein [Candidatus Cloacimonas sp.]
KIREKYSQLVQAQQQQLATDFKKMKIDLVKLRTDLPYAPELMKFFKFRLRRKNQG